MEQADALQPQIEALNKKLEGFKKQNEILQHEKEELKRENDTLKATSRGKNQHSNEFWSDVRSKIKTDPDYIKSLIKNKTLTVFDTNSLNQTLLSLAASRSYEIVQLCLNLGADIHHKDQHAHDALYEANTAACHDIEQLLLFSKMNANIGNRIHNTSDTIKKQKGIIENIINRLSLYKNTKTIFKDTLIDIMINIISNKLAFSDILLNLCWEFVCGDNNANTYSSPLWKCIEKTCKDIIQNGNKRDWVWLKAFIVPSTIWYKVTDDEKGQETTSGKSYLYFRLLKLVEGEAKQQLNGLERDLNMLSNRNKRAWHDLIEWNSTDTYDTIRQDAVPNGIQSPHTIAELSQTASSSTFNASKFYDMNEYLSELVLLAHIVDDSFQKSVQNIFNINKNTNIGYLKGNDDAKHDSDDTKLIQYMRGPVKLIDRARSKAENDYSNEPFPTSACILDLNRCSLVFNDISTLLSALKLFVNKVEYYQSDSIIGIVRHKNGFMEYVKETQYADIKLNILIKGKTNNIIGEVQFLLRAMMSFKSKAHNLYAIQRQKEYIENSVSSILPMLLDDDKELFIAGAMGNVKAVCNLMAINNKTEKDIMKLDKESNESILLLTCSRGFEKAFKFLKSMIRRDLFIHRLFLPNRYNANGIEYAMQGQRRLIIENVLSMKEVQQKYHKDDDQLFRLMTFLLVSNEDLVDYVLTKLNISNEKIIQFMNYKYPKPSKELGYGDNAWKYHSVPMVYNIVSRTKINMLKKLVTIVGQKEFIDNIFVSNWYNINGLELAVLANKLDFVKYMMSFKTVKDRCLNDQEILFRIIFWMFNRYNQSMFEYVVKVLQLDQVKLKEIQSYTCSKITNRDLYHERAWSYHNRSITDDQISKMLRARDASAAVISEEKVSYEGVTLWGVNSNDDIYCSVNGTGNDWKQISGNLKCVSMGSDGSVWGVNSSNDIYRYCGNNKWEQIEGSLKQVSCGKKDHIWGCNSNDDIYSYKTGRGWKQMDGKLVQISCGGDNEVWGVNSSDHIYRRKGENGKWKKIDGSLTHVSVGEDGTVWGVNRNHDIYKYLGIKGWQKMSGSAVNVTVVNLDIVYMVNAGGEIFKYEDDWHKLPGSLKYASAACVQ